MRYLGNRASGEFHDLDRRRPGCQIDEIVAHGHDRPFDSVEEAIRAGFEPCGWCLGTFGELALAPQPALASAADLEAEDLGGGRAALRWTYPADPVAQGIRFDVYASEDPLQPQRRLALAEHEGLAAQVGGLAGEVFLSVVARRGGQLALPSATVALTIAAPVAPVAVTPAGARGEPVGLGFPFRIDPGGGVHAASGDPLLRQKVLQLLLTAPGERVCVPEFGTRLRDLVFDPGNDVLAAATEFAVTQALRRYLGDQLAIEGVRVSSDEAELAVDVTYVRTADLGAERLRVGIPIPR